LVTTCEERTISSLGLPDDELTKFNHDLNA
jgi:hypothetical protein